MTRDGPEKVDEPGAGATGRSGWLFCPGPRVLLALVLATASVAGWALAWSASRVLTPVVRVCLDAWEHPLRCEGGRWAFPDARPHLVAETRDLAIVVDPEHSGGLRSPAMFQIQWGRQSLRVYGPLGWREWSFPADWTFELDPQVMRARWEAWRPFVWLTLGVGTALGLMGIWFACACVYGLGLAVMAVCLGRRGSAGLIFRCGWAVQLPGAWLMTVAVAGYGQGWLDLADLVVAWVWHWVVTVLLVLVTPLGLPRRAGKRGEENPFLA
ncbi:hypothetical protein [Limisphaera ngatamarikiensis]|uniref:hypothetical protein n=1 Tax=Limisphaera ngatamarikiensis TaxID=1324935 RepID=UPI0013EE0E7F|nr:hypothetical protein [Limisphaera ngatamarikiensis]